MKPASVNAEPVKEPMKTGIIMSIVQHVEVPCEVGKGTATFGQSIDAMIAEAKRNGDKVQGFEIVISDEDWWRMVNG